MMQTIQDQRESWLSTLAVNQMIIEKQLDGLTHQDSLLELPFRGNRLNWIVGHLAEHRDWMLRAVDQKTLMPATEGLLYRRDSEPISDEVAVKFDMLLSYLKRSKSLLEENVKQLSDVFLQEIPQTGVLLQSHRERTRLQRLQGLIWHETYHVGQLELLRQLTGINDKIL